MSASAEEPRAVEGPGGWAREQLGSLKELLDKPLTTYYLIIMCSALLLALGLMMVLSASSVEALQKTGSPFSWFFKQSLSAAVGLPVMWACSRLPVKFFRWAGYPMMALSILALVMVLFIGSSELARSGGSTSARSPCSRPSRPSSGSCCGGPTCWPGGRGRGASSGGSC